MPQALIHDRRRQALKRPYEGWLAPALNTDFLSYEPDEFRNWPFAVWGGWTFRLWSYTFYQPASGVLDFGEGYDLHFQLIDYEQNPAGETPPDDTGVVWTHEAQQSGSPQRGEPITTIDVDSASKAKCYVFRLINEGDVELTGGQRVAIQARYTIEPTGWRRNE